jgi:hypothetical protein
MTVQYAFDQFSKEDIQAFEPAMKVGILATVNPQGLPHVTMISTLKAAGPGEICWGQFIEGQSKHNIRQNPKTGWLIMNLEKELWRGKSSFKRTAQSGVDYDFYNDTPLFRYNAYFGVHTVYYMDLLGHTGRKPLPMNSVVFGSILTILARTLRIGKSKTRIMNSWTTQFLNQLTCLKFLSYLDTDGFPVIIPVIQAQAADPENILISAAVFGDEMAAIPTAAPVALLGLALTMEDVLMRGTWQGLKRQAGIKCGSIKVDWVYNPMPPVPGQIYPPMELKTIVEF